MQEAFRGKFFGIKINRVIEFLTLSDLLMLSGWGLVTPIIAVFFTEQIIDGSVALAGLASTAYFLTKSLLQIPIARFIDSKRGEWDDYYVLLVGTFTITICAFLYIFIKYPWQVIAVQMLYGVGGALSYPAWLAIFTRHIDRTHEGFEWSLYFTSVDVAAAIAGGLGGLLASAFGYRMLFVVVAVFSLIGTLFLAGITRQLKRH